MNIKGIFYDDWEAESKFIDSNEDCSKAFGYDELHLTPNTIEKLKHGKDLIVDIQGCEYVLRIMWKEENDDGENNNIPIPDNATNGEILCMLFPNMRYTLSDKSQRVITTIGVASSFDLDWWNTPYQKGYKK